MGGKQSQLSHRTIRSPGFPAVRMAPVFLLVLVALMLQPVLAATWGPYNASSMRTIYAADTAGSYSAGNSGTHRLGAYTTTNSCYYSRVLVAFPTTGMPGPALITGGTFTAVHDGGNYSATVTITVSIFRITRSWNASATWLTYDGTNNWTTPGGDKSAAFGGTQTFVGNPTDKPVKTWTWTTAGGDFRYGIEMQSQQEGSISYRKGVGNGGAEGPWPTLTLTYNPLAAPASAAVGAVTTTSIVWNWGDIANEDGFRVYDASSGGNNKSGTLGANTVSWTETGLSPNTSYTRYPCGYSFNYEGPRTALPTTVTLSVPPSTSTVTCDKPTNTWSKGPFTFTAVGGFGAGKVQYYRYAWDQSPTHTWSGSEAQWSSGTLQCNATSNGSWYLHVKGYNSANVENGTLDLGPYYYEGDAPTVDNATTTPENVGSTGNYLKGKLWVNADVADTGGSGLASVQIKLDDGDYETMPAKEGGDPGEYEKEYTIDASWANGAHSVTIKATDGAGNTTTCEPMEFEVNKNEVSGTVGLQGFTSALTYRDVVFVLNGTTAKVVNLGFLNGVAAYSIVDVPDLSSISAKTAWSLRRKMSVSAADGQYVADFVGSSVVRGGDLNGDNVVNALDYSVLRGAWGSGSAGDINGDGYTDNSDYLIMKANWYGKGDAQ